MRKLDSSEQSIAASNVPISHVMNGRIRIDKTGQYMLTSVDCPRDKDDPVNWENLCFTEGADKRSNAYVKSLNERFHGTTVFEPGVYGYQQHLWYAALSSSCVVFTTLPGSATDYDHMRPGYWHGNGVFPAVRQRDNRLGCIYEIPAHYPISFTHLFFPTSTFAQVAQKGSWLFGRCASGALGVWCSGELTQVDDVLSQCEYRCYDSQAAYYCVCEACEDTSTFESFIDSCVAHAPVFDKGAHTLHMGDGFELTYTPTDNKTQYI